MKEKQRIAVIGAGSGGCQALFLLQDIPEIELVAIADIDPTAPGIVRAHCMNLNVLADYKKVAKAKPDIILNLTGKKEITQELQGMLPSKTVIISGQTVEFFFNLLMHSKAQENKLSQMVKITRMISITNKYETLVKKLLKEIAGLLSAEIAGFLLYEPETDELVAQKPAFGVLDDSLIERYRVPLSFDTILRDVFTTGKPYFNNDPKEDPRTLKSVIEMFGVKNVATVPLRVEGENIGILHIANKMSGPIVKNDVDLLNSLSSHIAMILKNARLHRSEQERLEELASLLNASRSLTSAKNYQDILNSVAKEADNMMNAKFGAVLLVDEKSKYLEIVAGHNLSKNYIDALNNRLKVKVGEGASGRAVKYKKPVTVENVFTNKIYNDWRFVAEQEGYASMIALPLIFHGKSFGVVCLYFEKPKKFKEKEINLLSTMINDAAIAIEYSRKQNEEIERANELAIKDYLTDLYNHRYFHETLKTSFDFAKRNNGNLSLLIIDMDNFKNYNDTFGHMKGDEALKIVGSAIKTMCRKMDVPCRYGGDEFVVVLPGADRATAEKVAKRIKKAILDLRINPRDGQIARLSASIGIATYPEDAETSLDLLDFADKSLYGKKISPQVKV